MEAPKRVLCIMDLSVVGRAGLAVAAPVLAACGAQACALPSALFSAHTGGFGAVEKRDEADFCAAALAHYKRENLHFDALLVGYLCTPGQFDVAEAALRQYPDAYKIVDPAMADGGRLYGGLPEDVVERMAALCRLADLMTPNHTESALLAGVAPDQAPPTPARMADRLKVLSGGARAVVVTSVPTAQGGFEIAGCGPGGADAYTIATPTVPQNYPGAGDSFTAALAGLVLAGHPPRQAATRAAAFVRSAAQATWAAGGEVRHGLWLEPFLHMLAPAAQG